MDYRFMGRTAELRKRIMLACRAIHQPADGNPDQSHKEVTAFLHRQFRMPLDLGPLWGTAYFLALRTCTDFDQVCTNR